MQLPRPLFICLLAFGTFSLPLAAHAGVPGSDPTERIYAHLVRMEKGIRQSDLALQEAKEKYETHLLSQRERRSLRDLIQGEKSKIRGYRSAAAEDLQYLKAHKASLDRDQRFEIGEWALKLE